MSVRTPVLPPKSRAAQLATVRPDTPASIVRVLTEHETACAAIDPELRPEVQQQRRGALEHQIREALPGLIAHEVTAVRVWFDQAEAELRQALQADPPLTAKTEWRADLTQTDYLRRVLIELSRSRHEQLDALDLQEVRELTDPDALAERLEEILGSDRETLIRRAGPVVVRRLQAAADAERRLAMNDPAGAHTTKARVLAERVDRTWRAWQQAHPTLHDQIRAVESQRNTAEFKIQHAATEAIRFVLGSW